MKFTFLLMINEGTSRPAGC